MKTAALAALLIAAPGIAFAQTKVTDKPFVSGGRVNIHLEAGEYEVRAAKDDHVRVTMTGDMGNTVADVEISGTQAGVNVHNTPNHSNHFHIVVEVPRVSDITIRLTAGDLTVGDIAGSKDIETRAGDVKIAAGDPNLYAKVDASVTIGDINPGPFGSKTGGFGRKIAWTGKGKYTFRAHLLAGDLKIN